MDPRIPRPRGMPICEYLFATKGVKAPVNRLYRNEIDELSGHIEAVQRFLGMPRPFNAAFDFGMALVKEYGRPHRVGLWRAHGFQQEGPYAFMMYRKGFLDENLVLASDASVAISLMRVGDVPLEVDVNVRWPR